MDMDAGFRQRRRADLRKAAGIVTAVIADGAALLPRLSGEIGRETARRLADGIGVEVGNADAHHAADTAGAEGLLMAEVRFDLRRIVLNAFQLLQNFAVCVCKPAFVFLLCKFIHRYRLRVNFWHQYTTPLKKTKDIFCKIGMHAAGASGSAVRCAAGLTGHGGCAILIL